MLGCETEFVVTFEDANGYPTVLHPGNITEQLGIDRMRSILGTDGCQYLFEYRSLPSESIADIVGWFSKTLEDMRPHLPTYAKLLSIPFLNVPEGRLLFCGGHIHFELTHMMKDQAYSSITNDMMMAMDTFCIEQFQDVIAPKNQLRCANGEYGGKFKDDNHQGMRRKPHGIEYRSCITFSAYPHLMWAYLTIGQMVYRSMAFGEYSSSPNSLSDLCKKFYHTGTKEIDLGIECIEKCLSNAPLDLYVDMTETWHIERNVTGGKR